MKSKFVLSFVLAILLVAPSTAADDLGVYFDQNGYYNCADGIPLGVFYAYLLYTNPSVSEITGFELGIDITGPLLLAQVTTPCGVPVPVADVAQISVQCDSPIPCSSSTLLLTLQLIMPVPQWGSLKVRAADSPTSPFDTPNVILPDETRMGVSAMEGESYVYGQGINECYPTAARSLSWGTIKGLFR